VRLLPGEWLFVAFCAVLCAAFYWWLFTEQPPPIVSAPERSARFRCSIACVELEGE
jgi:hypothetical protein